MKVNIIGAGPGDERYLTDYARDLILDAGTVVATPRLKEQLWHLNPNTICCEADDLAETVLEMLDDVANICILVEGDAGFFSISESLARQFKEADVAYECVSGVSSLQYLANALGCSYHNVVALDLSAGKEIIVPYVCYNHKVFALLEDGLPVKTVLNELEQAGLVKVKVSVGENLGVENERIVTDIPANLLKLDFAEPAVMLVENKAWVDNMAVIEDDEYVQGKSALPRQAVRRLALAELMIRPDDVIATIGAGGGAACIEAARMACRGRVFALEEDLAVVSVIKQNIAKFGAYNLAVISKAPLAGIQTLPKTDKVFINGAVQNLAAILKALIENNPAVKIVVNAHALETVSETLEAAKTQNLTTDIMCVNVARAEKTGNFNLMLAQNPVYVISVSA